ncbi:hypothetical protein CR165_22485 [Pseudoroseomonas aestuarii]|uniref:Polysaccharide biosynthesis protein n=1 Tax=Teichococcus aestuarii TaxID=568898 RepID=A0A2U1UY53_9PROT|nr:hypothetical protein CR165_22485 [Pseudoroseomonas aestuarii]
MLALGMRFLSAGLGYLLFALAARVTDVAGFNDFALIFAAVGLFGPVATLGQDQQMLRVLPILQKHGQVGYRKALRRAARMVGLGVILCTAAAGLYGWMSLADPSASVLCFLAVLVVANGLTEFLFGADRGSGSVLGAVAAREILWKLVLLVPMAVLWFLAVEVSAATLAAFYALGLAASLALFLFSIARWWRRAPPERDGETAAAVPGSSVALLLLSLVSQAGVQVDTLVLGIAAGFQGAELGAYFAAQRLTQLLYFIPFGVNMTNAPRIPVAWAQGDVREIVRLSRQASRGMGAAVLLVALVLVLFREEAMSLFRPEFAAFSLVLILLSASPVVAALAGMNHVIPAMCGGEVGYARARIVVFLMALAAKLVAAWAASLLAVAAINVLEAVAIGAVGVLSSRAVLGRVAL